MTEQLALNAKDEGLTPSLPAIYEKLENIFLVGQLVVRENYKDER